MDGKFSRQQHLARRRDWQVVEDKPSANHTRVFSALHFTLTWPARFNLPHPCPTTMSERAVKKIKELQLKKSNTECFVCNTKARLWGRQRGT
jgi:hypothetical protein